MIFRGGGGSGPPVPTLDPLMHCIYMYPSTPFWNLCPSVYLYLSKCCLSVCRQFVLISCPTFVGSELDPTYLQRRHWQGKSWESVFFNCTFVSRWMICWRRKTLKTQSPLSVLCIILSKEIFSNANQSSQFQKGGVQNPCYHKVLTLMHLRFFCFT